MVLMGINRIIVTSGRLRAAMGIHIDATDRATREQAEEFGVAHKGEVSVPLMYVSISASHSITYVRSSHADDQSELNVNTDLVGEVEIHFMSDFFPVQRFATNQTIGLIQANTPNPEANPPATPRLNEQPVPWGTPVDFRAPERATRPTPLLGNVTRPDAPALQTPGNLPIPTGGKKSDEKSEAKPDQKSEAAPPTQKSEAAASTQKSEAAAPTQKSVAPSKEGGK
jgi:hypothetical protein